MATYKNQESLIVFTFKNKDELIKNGSGDWIVDKKRAGKCKYVIASRNLGNDKSNPSENENHQEGFLIAEISNIVSINKSEYPKKREKRVLIQFNKYAEIKLQNLWRGLRNPVKYIDTSTIPTEYNINLEELDWKEAPDQNSADLTENESFEGLTIFEAKKRIAKSYDIPETNIEIIIKV